MLSEEKRTAIKTLYHEGTSKNEIARMVNVDPKTVRAVLREDGQPGQEARRDKKGLDIDLLRDLYQRCDGYMQRMHEILTEEHKVNVGYSTLTRFIRAKGIGKSLDQRYHWVQDVPGEEMQHDTSPYKLNIGHRIVKVVCSAIYFRYSKVRYVRFYLNFNRFRMKCFMHEALMFLKYSAKTCVIDNTNLAVLRGTGRDAIFNPEMMAFAKNYGFRWLAHEKGHANRKAGKERNFRTINTSFLPGREFKDMTDLNAQVFDWASERYARRPQSKTQLIPVELFESEKAYLIKLPGYILPPSQEHYRSLDEHGYIGVHVNYYWVTKGCQKEVPFVEYAHKIKIFPRGRDNKAMPALEYALPEMDIRNKAFKPDGVNTNPYQPRNRKKPSDQEERYIRDLGEPCCAYLDFIKSEQCQIACKQKFMRELYLLKKKTAPCLFMAVIKRALSYRVTTIDGLMRICKHLMIRANVDDGCIEALSCDYQQRESYQQGRFSSEANIENMIRDIQPNDEDSCDGQ